MILFESTLILQLDKVLFHTRLVLVSPGNVEIKTNDAGCDDDDDDGDDDDDDDDDDGNDHVNHDDDGDGDDEYDDGDDEYDDDDDDDDDTQAFVGKFCQSFGSCLFL